MCRSWVARLFSPSFRCPSLVAHADFLRIAGADLPPQAPAPLQRERSRSASPTPASRRRFLATPGSDSTESSDVHGGSGAFTARQAATDEFFDVRQGFKAAVPPESVRVYARVRPMTMNEAKKDKETMTFGADAKAVCLRLEDDVPHDFRFSHVFPPECSQMDVFHQAGRPVVEAVLSGFNAAILCYGQTGSGKTHTMIGANVLHHEERGLVPRIMEHIFHVQAASPPQFVYETRCSFIEIYLDKLSDLLAPVKARALKLRERGDGSFFTTATQVPVQSVEEVMTILVRGNMVRSTATTDANQRSSRSHAIFIVEVSVTDTTAGLTRSSELYLVDLAGSESMSNLVGENAYGPAAAINPQRIKEMKRINVSLLALGNVINALTSPNPSGFVPFRSSVLTKILRNSFGGNSKTSLIINVSPTLKNGKESLSALRFGARASAVRNIPVANEKRSVEELRRLVDAAKATEVFQEDYERELGAVLLRLKSAALALYASVPAGPRDSRIKHSLVSNFSVLRDAVRGYGIVKRLPAGILRTIFSYCDGTSLLVCRKISKDWRQMASNEALWTAVCNTELTGVLRTVREGMTMIEHFSAVMKEIVAEAKERDKASLEIDRAQVFPRGGFGLHLLKG